MKNNPERTAWTILIISFTTFCSLCIIIPTSIYWYVINATVLFDPDVTSVRGTVLLGEPDATLSASLTGGNTTTVQELYQISTDDTSQAILRLFDDSSLTLYSNTRIILHEIREPRFSFSYRPSRLLLEIQQGRIRATSARDRTDINIDINTPHAQIALGQGIFSVDVDEEETQVTPRLGEANVLNPENENVLIREGQRAVAGQDSSLLGPLPAAKNLLETDTFSPDFDQIWQVYVEEPIEGVETTAIVEEFRGQNVLVLRSQGRDNVHTEIGVIQNVNKDVRDFQSVRVFAEVRLSEQSLSGGGQLGSEFPIMLHVAYEDADGNERNWLHGFYYSPPPENYILYNQPDNSSERIARFIWYPYESVNLLTTLGPTKPVFIKSIRIYASGWIYEGMVRNISLLAEE